MPTLIVQADDYAISDGVTEGILRAVEEGIVRATGIFTNRPSAALAASRIRDLDRVDVGLDLNMVTGAPILPAREVPSLVNAHDNLRTSHQITAEFPVIARDGMYSQFEVDPFDHDETLAEARAQLDRFVELFGRAPAYVHHHSIISPMLDQVLHEVAAQYSVPVMDDLLRDRRVNALPNPWYTVPFGAAEQAACDPVSMFLAGIEELADHEISVLITHPGYVDADLLDISSYNVVRARDLQLVTAIEVREALTARGVACASYSDCGLLR